MESLKIESQVVERRSQDLPEVQPAIIWSRPNNYLLRASSQEDITYLKDFITRGLWFDKTLIEVGLEEQALPPAPVSSRVVIDLGHIKRALAKSALNFLCAALGPDKAREECFAALRDFIMTETRVSQTEFVKFLWGRQEEPYCRDIAGVFATEGYHTLILQEVENIPYVYFLLYARPFAVVRLVTDAQTPILGTAGTRIALFNYRTQTHSVFTWEQWGEDIVATMSPDFR